MKKKLCLVPLTNHSKDQRLGYAPFPSLYMNMEDQSPTREKRYEQTSWTFPFGSSWRYKWTRLPTLHPINTRTTFEWRKTGGICVKWRNFLKKEEIERQSPTTNCSLVKYIMLLGRSIEDRASSSVSWIRILSGIRKQTQNSPSDRTLTRWSSLRHPTLVFFRLLYWGFPLPLVEAIHPLAIMLSGSGSCGNLCGTMQLLEPITWPIYRSVLP